jgi:hypothetical protein
MWAAVRAGRRSKARLDPGGASRIIRWDKEYIGDPPPAVARLITRLQAGGWAVRMIATTVRTEDLLYVGQSDDHDPGDVRTPAYDSRHFFLQGVLVRQDVRIAWFKATWERRGAGGNAFGHAQTWDVAYGRDWEPGATGFESWISVFTPKPPPKTKRKQADAGEM